MKFDPKQHIILAEHLKNVEAVLKRSNVSLSEADGIVEDLAAQINAMVNEHENDLSETDQVNIRQQLDPPERYADVNDSIAQIPKEGAKARVSPSWFSLHPIATTVIPLISIAAGLVGWLISLRNDIVSADETVDASFAQVETVLQRRFDLIPNLVSTVKGFAKQEKEILTEVTRLRSQWAAGDNRSDRIETSNQLEGALSKLLVVTENYPQLRSSEQFSNLQFQLEGTENRISVERNRFNNAVRYYNTLVRKFPANLLGYPRKDSLFKAVKGADQPPKVTF